MTDSLSIAVHAFAIDVGLGWWDTASWVGASGGVMVSKLD